MGNDEKVLRSGSDSQKRMAGYGFLAEQIYVVVFSNQQLPVQRIGNVFIYSSGGCCRWIALLKGYFLAKKLVKREKIGVVSSQDPFEGALAGQLLRKSCSIKLNIQIHGDFFSQNFWRRQRWFNFLRYYEAAWLLKKADSIRGVSERIKKSLIDKFQIPSGEIVVAPIFSDFSLLGVPPLAERSHDLLRPFVFLTASRLTKEKNLPMALSAFSKLREGDREAVLKIVGDGIERKNLECLVRKLKIEGKVEFLGWLGREALAGEYAKADCFLLASDFEGWGLAPLEAAYFGLPIVMTDVGVCGEVFAWQRDVLCSPPRDEEKFLANMRKILDNAKLRQELSQNAKAALAKLPTKEQTMTLYKKAWFIN